MKYLYVFMGMLGLWVALTSCRTTSSEEPLISVTIEPQRYFVEQIAGETFQVKEDITPVVGQSRSLRFDLARIPQGRSLIVYGGDGNRKLDYPVRLLGFNFEFVRSDESGTLTVRPPEFDKTTEVETGGGGGAVAME